MKLSPTLVQHLLIILYTTFLNLNTTSVNLNFRNQLTLNLFMQTKYVFLQADFLRYLLKRIRIFLYILQFLHGFQLFCN